MVSFSPFACSLCNLPHLLGVSGGFWILESSVEVVRKLAVTRIQNSAAMSFRPCSVPCLLRLISRLQKNLAGI